MSSINLAAGITATHDQIDPTRALVEKSNSILQSILDGDGVFPPDLDQELAHMELTQPERADLAFDLLERSKAEAAFWTEKADSYYKLGASFKELEKKIRNGVKLMMVEGGLTDLHGVFHRFKLREIDPRLDVNEAEITAEYQKQVIETVVDTDKIKEALKAGKRVPGAKLISNFNLTPYKNREKIGTR